MTGRQWVIPLRAPGPMHTTNAARRLHWGKTSGERRALREVTHAEAQRAKLPRGLQRIRIDIEVRFPDRRRRDASNLGDQVGKPIVDALGPARTVKDKNSPTGWRRELGYGLVPDDHQDYVDGPHITTGAPVDQRRYPFGAAIVTITDLSGGTHE